jgi:hypothetical protein
METPKFDFEYYDVKKIMQICHVGQNKAYQIIQELNALAKESNPETIIIKGKAKSEYVHRYLKE